MQKFRVTTEKQRTVTYYLTYEIVATSKYAAKKKVKEGGYVPVDEEFLREDEEEDIIDCDEIEEKDNA